MMGLSPLKIALAKFSRTDKPIEIVNAYVHRDYREGQGIGTTLVNALTQRAISRGNTEMLLDSGPRYKNTGWGFWDRQPGFERVGLAKNLYGRGLDAPVWRKSLS
jgi:ribosomal protein S18 acetylase RimI-like enzyme